MKLIVGLGNPGTRYSNTRHNVGFLALERCIQTWKATGPQLQHQGELYSIPQQSNLGIQESCYLIRPQTYMNCSGDCVGSIFNYYRCQPEDLIVIYDDLDLTPFCLRLKKGGGSGGHKGIQSIDQSLGSKNCHYYKIRVGIGRPLISKMSPADYVLQSFADCELKKLDSTLDAIVSATQMVLRGDIQKMMNHYHRIQPKVE